LGGLQASTHTLQVLLGTFGGPHRCLRLSLVLGEPDRALDAPTDRLLFLVTRQRVDDFALEPFAL
jgi:hypothetical protein